MDEQPPVMPAVIATVAALRERLHGIRTSGDRIGLVPTMGALHDGHAALIRQARADCDCVVVSIFVNPLQFDRREDLAAYPRALADDTALCAQLGTDIVFAPAEQEVYPEPPVLSIDIGPMADHLCGRFRPGHFRGVATVVMKLLQMVQPHAAYFGDKDAQQIAIVRRLVSDFSVPVVIVGMPTVRADDGLALSSRNRRLSPEERGEAVVLYRALSAARERIESGERDAGAVKQHAGAILPPDRTPEYLEIVEPVTMQPVDRITGPVIVAGAIWFGGTRLIDNVRAKPPS